MDEWRVPMGGSDGGWSDDGTSSTRGSESEVDCDSEDWDERVNTELQVCEDVEGPTASAALLLRGQKLVHNVERIREGRVLQNAHKANTESRQ